MTKNTKKKLKKSRNIISLIFQWILNGSHDYYLCYLPINIGFLLQKILKIFFSPIVFDDNQYKIINDIATNNIVIYATKYKNYFEYLFYYTRYNQLKLPVPEIGFDLKSIFLQPVFRFFKVFIAHISYFFTHFSFQNPYKTNYIKQQLLNGKSALFSLVEPKGFYRRFVKSKTDPICYLIDMQKQIDKTIYIVPQQIFLGSFAQKKKQTPIDFLFGTEEKPKTIRRIISLLKRKGQVFSEVVEPINLKQILSLPQCKDKNSHDQAVLLRRFLVSQINAHRQSVTGPLLKTTHELKENILTDDNMQKFMANYAKNQNIPKAEVHKNADSYIDEIASKYNVTTIKIFDLAITWSIKHIFDGVSLNTDALAKIKAESQQGTLVFMPCHKSHIDYLILSYILAHNNMAMPLIAAGKNLSFWPIGPILRGGGAFFMRRTFKGNDLYKEIFEQYLYKIIKEGFNVEFFVEGGRSRTGKLLRPKVGLLSMLIDAYKVGACKDVIFVPVYIGYDRVVEETSYINEIEGKQKKGESFGQVLKARKVLKKRFGKIYLRFGDTVSLKKLSENVSIESFSKKKQYEFCNEIGYKILNLIDKVTVVTPHAVVASALLNIHKSSFSHQRLLFTINTYLNYLLLAKVKLSDTLFVEKEKTIDKVIDQYIHRKLIDHISNENEKPDHKPDDAKQKKDRYNLIAIKRPLLDYYKSTCIAYFIPPSFTALSILAKDAFCFASNDLHESYTILQKFFKFEFAYDKDKAPTYLVRKSIKAFIDDGILMPHPTLFDTYNVTSIGFRKLKLFACFLKTYLESYWIVLNHFIRMPNKDIDIKDRLNKIYSMGNRMYKRNEIERREAISKVNLKNAVDFFIDAGIYNSENTEQIKYYSLLIQKYLYNLR